MARYFDTEKLQTISEPKILIRVAPDINEEPIFAVVDTGAPWCVFRPASGIALSRNFGLIPGQVTLSTRFGLLQGTLYRGPIRLHADEGEPLDVEATVFLSPQWRGPNFLGYEGLLQRIRFAVDPETNLFYFGRI